jgi:alkylhydroperoxidase family enzyme
LLTENPFSYRDHGPEDLLYPGPKEVLDRIKNRDARMGLCMGSEAGNIFTEEEQLLLAITEEITLIHQHGLIDDLYNKAIALLGEEKTAQVIMAIITINAWNLIGVGLSMHPAL